MIAIIPARSGSKTVPHKNIKLLGDHPLIAYSIIACKLSTLIDRIIVSTDCNKIANIALRYGAEIPFLRPKELATDTSSDVGFLKHFFKNIPVEEVALIRPTSPLRDPSFIDKTIQFYKSVQNQCTGIRSLTEVNESPYKLYKLENGICQGFFSEYQGIEEYSNLPRQIFPKTYNPNGHIDIVKRLTITKGSTFGNKIFGIESSEIIDIDSQYDFDIAELQLNTKYDRLSVHLKTFI